MKDIFISQGKKYISARRASDISDYSSDYIGQLCRAGKLDCTMVGRSWFVTEESLHIHQAGVLHKEIYRNRVANFQGGRKSTTSTKGNESLKSKIELEVKQETAQTQIVAPVVIPAKATREQSERSRSRMTAGIQNNDLGDTVNFTQPVLNASRGSNASTESTVLDSSLRWNDNTEEKLEIKPIVWKFTYATDERPLLPILGKSKTFSDQKITVADKPKENKLKAVPSPIPVRAFARTSVPISTPTYPTLARSIILRRVLSSVAVVILIFSFIGGVMFISEQPQSGVVAQNVSANVFDTVQTVISFFKNSYDGVLALLHKEDKQVAINVPSIIPAQSTSQGIAVVSSSGTTDGDEAIKDKIKDSFSDVVKITPDQSGTAGVITPVFKKTTGDEFIYVLVPVKEKK